MKNNIIGTHTYRVAKTWEKNVAKNHGGLSVGDGIKLVREQDNMDVPFTISVETLSGLKLGCLEEADGVAILTYLDNNLAVVGNAVVANVGTYKTIYSSQSPLLEIELDFKPVTDKNTQSPVVTKTKPAVKEVINNPEDFDIEDGVLKRYKGKDEIVIVPDGITSIGEEAFLHCEKLTEITLPDSVTSIENVAFYACKGLKKVTYAG